MTTKKTTKLEAAREEARAMIKESMDNIAMRSCWNCNPAHKHLKQASYVIVCFICGHYFYNGLDITEVHDDGPTPKRK